MEHHILQVAARLEAYPRQKRNSGQERQRAADQEKDRTADARFDEAARIDEKEAAPQEAQKGEMDL